MIIFDPSASMTETYLAADECVSCHKQYKDSAYAERHAVKHGGQEFSHADASRFTHRCSECHQDYLYSKFKFAKDLTRCFNQTIPDFDFTSALRLFGSPAYTSIAYGPTRYDKKELDHQLRKILDADGVSPLDMALEAASKDWFGSKGPIAVIIVSDGKDMGTKEVLAAEDLKARYNERVCLYTVQIGNDKNGEEVLTKIAQAGQCGLSINGDTLLNKDAMADLTKEIFLTKTVKTTSSVAQIPAKAASVTDTDKDGVPDFRDDCPDTRPGLKVDKRGCWQLVVAADILFDFDKYVFKPKGIKILDQVVNFMNKYPFIDLAISGHTDNFGSMAYNIVLSKRRTMAGLHYLVQKGIDKKRISVSWHSFLIPRASNDTAVGRALNRRLEFKFSKR